MTFDPRWLNQLPLSSIKGEQASEVYSLIGSNRMNVTGWTTGGSLTNLITGGTQAALSTTPLKSGNVFVVYADTTNIKATIRNSFLTSVSGISPVTVSAGGSLRVTTATLSNGNVAVVYSDSVGKLSYTIYNDRLQVVRSATQTTVYSTEGWVTSLADGNFAIAYDSTGRAAFQIFDIDGDLVKGETITSTSYSPYGIIGLRNGNFLVALLDITVNSLYISIYNRQGTRVLAPTLFSTNKWFIDQPLALLTNGNVAIGYVDIPAFTFGYGIVDENGNTITAPAPKSGSAIASASTAGIVSLLNNGIGMSYATATAMYYRVDVAGATAQSIYTGSYVNNYTVRTGTTNDGKFFTLVNDITDGKVKYIVNIGSGTSFAGNLSTSGTLNVSGTSTLAAINASGTVQFGGAFRFGPTGHEVFGIANTPLASDNTVLPTSYAVKEYIDQQTGNIPRNIIHQDNSKVEVIDTTAGTQYITFEVNGSELARIEDLGSAQTLRLGPSGDTRIDLNTNTDIVSVTSGATEVLNLGTSNQVLGVAADTAVSLDQSLNIISFKSANAAVGQFDANGLTLATGVAVNKFSNDATLGGYNGATGSDSIVASEKAVRGYIDGIHNAMRDPTGFVNRTSSTMAFGVDSSTTFSIEPVGSYDIFLRGQRYVIDSSTSVNITDVEGLHYIYFNSAGVLSHTTTWTIDLIYIYAYVATIYWDATNKVATYIGDERHGIVMDGATHYNLHSSRGTVYLDGLGIGDLVADGTGSLNTEAEFSVSAGTIVDEDITTSIPIKTVPAQIPMFYRSGTGNGVWRSNAASNYPVTNAGSGRMAWNEKVGAITWGLTEAVEGYYVLSHIFATNDYDNSRKIIGIAGQTQYSTLTAAKEAASVEINNLVLSGLPFAEFVAIGTFIFQTSSSYTNAPKASLRSVGGGSDYMDWRYAKITSVPGVVTDHGSLSGLGDDDHLQYARLSGTRPFTGLITFNAGITVAGGYLTLDNGVSVNDFSNDTLLAGDSSASVPTEHAVKSYVDTAIAGLNPNKIWQDDSKVEVIDDGTAPGYVQIVTDNVQVAYFDVLASTQRIGKTATNLSITDTTVKANVNSVTYLDIDPSGLEVVRLGRTGQGARLDLVTSDGGGFTFVTDPTGVTVPQQIGALDWGQVAFGRSAGPSFYMDLAGDTINLSRASGSVLYYESNIVNLGPTSGTHLAVDMATNNFNFYSDVFKTSMFDSTSINFYVNEEQQVFALGVDSFTLGNPNSDGYFISSSAATGFRVIDVNSGDPIALFDTNGLTLDPSTNSVSIKAFSLSVGLGDSTASNDLVPTQLAVKTYVDSQIGGQANIIFQQNSNVTVTDTGANGTITTTADGVEVANFQSATQRIGQSASSRVELAVTPAPTATIYAGSHNVFEASNTSVVVGHSNDTRMSLNQAADIVTFYAGNTDVGQLSLTTLRIGQAADSRLVLDTANDYADLYAGTTQIIDGATTSQIFGVASDSRLELNQSSDTADLYAGTAHIITGGLTAQTFGIAGDSRLTVDQFNDTVDLYAGTISVLGATTNVLTLGKSGDTYITLNQQDNLVNTYTGNTLQMQVENTGVSVEGDLTVRGNLSIDGTAFIVFNEEVKTQDNIITVNYGDPGPGVTRGIAGLEVARGSSPIYQFIFAENSDTFRVGEVGQTQAVATREDDPDGYKVAWWNDNNRRFETLGTEYIKVDQTSSNIVFATGNVLRGQFDSNGLTLQLGTSVNEFSTDVTLGGNSDDAVPTERAVKTYVDSQIGGQANTIFQDNSNVTVTDDGTAIGMIIVTADGTPVSMFQENYQLIGTTTNGASFTTGLTTFDSQLASDGFGVLAHSENANNYVKLGYVVGTHPVLRLFQDNTTLGSDLLDVTLMTAGSVDVVPFSLAPTTQTLGISGDSRIVVDQSGNTVNAYAGGSASVLSLGATSQTFGLAAASNLALTGTTANLFAGTAQVITTTATAQTFGLSANSKLDLANGTANLFAGTAQFITGAATAQSFGLTGDSRLDLNQSADTADLYAGANQIIDGNLTSQTFGQASDSRLFLDQGNDLADLYAGTTQIIDGGTTTQVFGVSGDSRLALDQTGDTAKLYAGAVTVLDGGLNVITLGTAADTSIALNQSGDLITFTADGTSQATFGIAGLTLLTGASIVEFSIDGTLVGNADTVVPTEKAVKTYVDTQINTLRQELDLINVRNVYTDTTASTGDVVLADTTAGDITIQLMESTDGKIIIKKKSSDGNKVYITTTPGLIDGQSQIIIDTGYQAYTFVCDGTNFFII